MSVNMVTSISEERLCTRKKTNNSSSVMFFTRFPNTIIVFVLSVLIKKNLKRKFDALNQFKREYK